MGNKLYIQTKFAQQHKRLGILILACATIALLILAVFAAISHQNPQIQPDLLGITEPDAPISTDATTTKFGEQQNKQELTISDLGKVHKLTFSPNKTNAIILTSSRPEILNEESNTNLIKTLIPPIYAAETSDSNQAYKLSIVDKSGKVIQTIGSGNILDAGYIDTDNIYYQVLGKDAGVYSRNLKNNASKRIIYTQQTQSFRNIAPISKTKYFFNRPTTGVLGFVDTNTNKVTVLNEKTLQTDSIYTKSSAFSYLSVSPDKKYVAVFDLQSDNNKNVTLLIYPTSAKSSSNLYAQIPVNFAPGNFDKLTDVITWSNDSKYINLPHSGQIIDIKAKKVVLGSLNNSAVIRVSPNLKQVFRFNPKTQTAELLNFRGKVLRKLKHQLGSFDWISTKQVILTIGLRLYTYNVSNGKLAALNQTRAAHTILDTDPNLGLAWVLEGEDILEIRLKK